MVESVGGADGSGGGDVDSMASYIFSIPSTLDALFSLLNQSYLKVVPVQK